MTAITGIAATHINGCTIHSFAGIGTGIGSRDQMLQMAQRREERTRRTGKTRGQGVWRATDVLVIDEVSMLTPDLFDTLEYCARTIRGAAASFGGLQVIACGDFLQLPPVDRDAEAHGAGGAHRRKYAFQSAAWGRVFRVQRALKTVLRQSDDRFINILNNIRHRGPLSPIVPLSPFGASCACAECAEPPFAVRAGLGCQACSLTFSTKSPPVAPQPPAPILLLHTSSRTVRRSAPHH